MYYTAQSYKIVINVLYHPQSYKIAMNALYHPQSYKIALNALYRPQYYKTAMNVLSTIKLKLVSAIFYQISIFSSNDRPSKSMKNVFYFIEKALFVLEIFKFL